MAVETNLEREFKFDLEADFEPPDLRPLVGRTERLPEQCMATTYFDTSDLRLWARGITLRHRVDDDAADRPPPDGIGKWTLKLPEQDRSDPSGLVRSELNWKGPGTEIPSEVRAILAGLVRRRTLDEFVVLRTRRRRLLLHGSEDRAWGEIDDDVVEVVAGGRKGWSFRQLELELVAPAPQAASEAADAVLGALRRAGASPGGGSKFALAAGVPESLRDRHGHSPDAVARGGLASMVSQMLTADLDRLLDAEYRLRLPDEHGDVACPPAGSVEKACTAARKVQSDLKALDGVLDTVWVRHARRELRWIGALLRRLADEDTVLARVRYHSDPEDSEGVDELLTLLSADRHLGALEMTEALCSPRYLDLLDDLEQASKTPPLFGAGTTERARPWLKKAMNRRRKAARSAALKLSDSPDREALRRAVVRAERLFDLAEAARPFSAKRSRRLLGPAGKLADRAYHLDRILMVSRCLRHLGTHPAVPPSVAFVAGRIAGRAEAEAAGGPTEWRRAASRLER